MYLYPQLECPKAFWIKSTKGCDDLHYVKDMNNIVKGLQRKKGRPYWCHM